MVISGLKSSENSLIMIARTTGFSEHPHFFFLGFNKGVINAVNREQNMKLCLWQPYSLSLLCMSMAFQYILEFTLIFPAHGSIKI